MATVTDASDLCIVTKLLNSKSLIFKSMNGRDEGSYEG